MTNTHEGKGFHLAILVGLGLCFVALVALQFIKPVHLATKAPKTVMASQSPIQTLPAKQATENDPRLSASKLDHAFAKLGYELPSLLRDDVVVPRIFISTLPYDLAALTQTEDRKSLFFRTLLPLILKINEEIVHKRSKVWRLKHRLSLEQAILPQEHIWLDATFRLYNVTNQDFDQLLRRMDMVPPSLALAQAAEESGWGTSRFAREGNALFGQWTHNPNDKGLLPANRAQGKTHRIKAFDSLVESFDAYIHNLNTHKAYQRLRIKRADMRKNRKPINGHNLASELDKYSERADKYVASLHAIIKKNDLARFDKARLDTTEIKSLTDLLI